MAPRVVAVVAILGAVWLVQPAFGQGRGSGAGSTGGGGSAGSTGTAGGGVSSVPGNIPSTSSGSSNTSVNPQPNVNTPIFLSGRVVLEDGSAPTEPVTIERVCNGAPHAEGYTDSKGYFAIQFGNENGVFQDASESGSTGRFGGANSGGASSASSSNARLPSAMSLGTDRRLMNCDLRAKLAGYRSQLVNLANHRALDNPDIGVILLHREGAKEDGTTVSAVSLLAPKDARKAYDKGMDALKKNKAEAAVADFQKAVELYPSYAAAWCELGKIQVGAGQKDTARTSFEVALKSDPKYIEPYVQLSMIAVDAKKWAEVAQITDRALKLNSFDYPQLFFFNAVANYNIKNFEISEKNALQAEKLDTRHVITQNSRLLGLIYARKGEMAAAAEHFKAYLTAAPDADDSAQTRKELQQVERILEQAAKNGKN